MACMARFEPGQAVEQFGDVRFDGDLAAVRKQSCLLPFSGLGEGDDKGAMYSDGNSLGLVNTKVKWEEGVLDEIVVLVCPHQRSQRAPLLLFHDERRRCWARRKRGSCVYYRYCIAT